MNKDIKENTIHDDWISSVIEQNTHKKHADSCRLFWDWTIELLKWLWWWIILIMQSFDVRELDVSVINVIC